MTARMTRYSDAVTPFAERAMVGVAAVTVLAGPAAGGASASSAQPVAQVASAPAATAPAPAAAVPASGAPAVNHNRPVAAAPAAHVPAPNPSPVPAVPSRPLGGKVPGLMSAQEARQQSAGDPYKVDLGAVYVATDPATLPDRLKSHLP